MTALEADVTFLNIHSGMRQDDKPPGFAVRAAPRRAARGRGRDLLFLALHLRSSTSPSAEWYQALLDLAAAKYFASQGSATSAIREMAGAVNTDLLHFNLRNAAGGAHVQAGMMAAVLRAHDLYLAQIGSGAALAIHLSGPERFPPEVQPEHRPLGVGQSFDLQYFHAEVGEGELLVLSAQLPAAWDGAVLAGLAGLALPIVVNRLERAAGLNASALIARFVPAGAVTSLPETIASSHPSRPLPIPLPSIRLPGALSIPATDKLAASAATPSAEPPPSPLAQAPMGFGVAPEPGAPPARADWAGPAAQSVRPSPPVHEQVAEEDEAEAPGEPSWRWRLGLALRRWRHRIEDVPLGRWSTALGRWMGDVVGSLWRGATVMLARILPEGTLSPSGDLQMPGGVLIAIAVGLPIAIGLLSAGVYIQRGRSMQYDEYLRQAQLSAALARTQPDAVAARPYWETALGWAERAEAVRPGTAEMAIIHDEGQAALDALDLVVRLRFSPLLPDGFGRGANITRVFVLGDDVFALNAATQTISRATRSVDGYSLAADFKCAGGAVGGYTVGPIVDMVWLPGPNVVGSEALMAIDNAGTLLLCTPGGEVPLSVELIPPDIGWSNPAALDLYTDRLYVLDPGRNEIWQYQQSSGLFTLPPSHYFTSVSYDLSRMVDFTISGNGDVFLLRDDGRVTFCTRQSGQAPVNCLESMAYSDPRDGHPGGERLDDLRRPAALVYDPPPEPSLYLLDKDIPGIFQLSLKLALQSQFRPAGPLPAPMAGLAIGPNKEILVAAGDNVYVAARP